MNLEEFGLSAQRMIAGFAGGVVHVFVFRQTMPIVVIGSIVSGTLTANYLGAVVARYVGSWIGDGGSAFIVGLSAMALCQGIVSLVRTRVTTAAKDIVP